MFSVSIIHLIIGVPDFDLYACLLFVFDCRQVQCWCSLVSMTNASARPPRFPSVLYDLGRWACTFQMSCLCSGPLGRVAPHLPTLCLADPADSRLACLSPTWLPAVSHLQMLSGCFGLHLLPTCLPTSPSMLWML